MPPKKAPPKPITLNSEQALAVNAGSGIWAIIAGAGSGKTSVLIARYQRLLREGVSPDQILGLTFTSNAAKGMRDRAGEVQKMDNRVNGFVTFHSLCLSICMAEREHFGFKLADFPLATGGQASKAASDVAKKYELNFKQLGSWISLQKRNGVRPAEAIKMAEKEGKNEKQALAYKAYDLRLREAMVLDFDSMMLEVVSLLKSSPDVLARWSFDWLMCDESQDCDAQQYELVRLLSQKSGNLYFVGDGGQGIYGFRGADSQMFMNIHEIFPSVQILYMAKNHRSTGKLVGFLKEIGPVPELAERFYTDNELGVDPVITRYPSQVDESEAIVQYVQSHPKTNTAVLTRTNRALRSVEDALSVAGIKYRLLSNSGFWTQSEVKAVCAYMSCISFPSDYALGTVLRSSFAPTKYLKRKVLADYLKVRMSQEEPHPTMWSELLKYRPSDSNQATAMSSFISFIHSLQRYREQKPQAAMQSLLQSLHVNETFDEESPDNSPNENIQELLKMAGRFSSIKDFISFTLKASAASKSRTGIILGTIHAAKGAEFNTVFLPSVCEGILPHSKAESLSEEKNIWFVGCSRAEKELYISYSGIASPFLLPFLKKEESIEEVFA